MAENRLAQEDSPIRAGFFDREAFQRKSRMLLVLQTGVAGFTHNVDLETSEGKALLESLTPGTELLLLRDTDNIHDKWAISVFTMDKQRLGYVFRFKNETVSRHMDLGKVFHAYVNEKRVLPDVSAQYRCTVATTEPFRVPFSVYMEEF